MIRGINMNKETKGTAKRFRLWMLIVYPDSAPEDWETILDDELGHTQWCHSPLHDKDVNADGTPKKAHWHVLLAFDGKKSYEQIEDITKVVNGTAPKVCQSASSMVRYFTHIDNPDKAQYDKKDIKAFGGMDVETPFTSSIDYQEKTFEQVFNIIQQERIYNIIDLEEYLTQGGLTDLKIFVHTNTLLVSKYLDGMYQKMAPYIKIKQREEEQKIQQEMYNLAKQKKGSD